MSDGGYRKLEIWQKGFQLVPIVYNLAKQLPLNEQHALSNQIRRNVVSIPSNIAEGWGRASTQDFIRFLRISRGSLMELETQILLAAKLGYIQAEQRNQIINHTDELSRMLIGTINGLIKKQKAIDGRSIEC